MEKWAVLSSQYVVRNDPYGSTRHDKCLLPSGHEIDCYIHEYPRWVNGVVLTPAMDLVLVRQYRHGIGDFVIETPGGMVDPDEDTMDAIIREVAEETGYRSAMKPVLLGQFFPNPATSNNTVSTYLFRNAERAGDQSLDGTEDITVQTLPFVTFGEMIRAGLVPQMFAVTGYYLAKEFLQL